jgi:hypothetical protein
MIDLLIKYPTRSRPDQFKKILWEYVNKLSGKINVKFIVSLDSNDPLSNTDSMKKFLETIKESTDLDYYYGVSKNKIDACNRDIPNCGWKVCLLISDDMTPRVKDYDKVIMNDMQKYFPNYDGVLNYNCGGHAYPKVMVLSVVGHTYYQKFNYIYHPAYTSLFSDEEQTVIARRDNKIVDIDHKIITHDWNDIQDDLRKHTEKFYQQDKIVFEERKQKGFPI